MLPIQHQLSAVELAHYVNGRNVSLLVTWQNAVDSSAYNLLGYCVSPAIPSIFFSSACPHGDAGSGIYCILLQDTYNPDVTYERKAWPWLPLQIFLGI